MKNKNKRKKQGVPSGSLLESVEAVTEAPRFGVKGFALVALLVAFLCGACYMFTQMLPELTGQFALPDEEFYRLRFDRLLFLVLSVPVGFRVVWQMKHLKVVNYALTACMLFSCYAISESVLMYCAISDGVGITFNHRIWELKYSLSHSVILFQVKDQKGNVIDQPQVRTNPWKLRPDSFCRRPAILAIGDSYTFGDGLSEDQTYPAVLQKDLENMGDTTTVTNLGIRGADSRMELYTLQQYFQMLGTHGYTSIKLREIFWQYCYNDVENIAKEFNLPGMNYQENPVAPYLLPLQNTSFVGNWLYWSFERQGVGESYKDYLRNIYNDKRVIQATVAPIANAANHFNGVPFVVVVFPVLQDLAFSDSIYQNLYAELDANHIHYIKVSDIEGVKKLSVSERLVSFKNPHPSAKVDELVADELKKIVIGKI